jgi:hypothetical protein
MYHHRRLTSKTPHLAAVREESSSNMDRPDYGVRGRGPHCDMSSPSHQDRKRMAMQVAAWSSELEAAAPRPEPVG